MTAKQLQQLLVDDVSIEDLILAQNDLKVLDAGFQEVGVQSPEWVTDKLSLVSTEIITRNKVELQRQLRAAKARRSSLATIDERRRKADQEIAELEAKLK